MSVSLFSSTDFALTSTAVNVQETLQAQKAAHDTRAFNVPAAKFKSTFDPVQLDMAGNARTINGGDIIENMLTFCCTAGGAGVDAAYAAANERALQDLYMAGIGMSLYACGVADSTTHKTIGTAQILAGAGTAIASGDAAGVATFTEDLFKNAGTLIKEALSKFEGAVTANKTSAADNWLHELLKDAHENSGTRSLTVAVSGEGAGADHFQLNLIAGDTVELYFIMTSDSDDGSLGTSRADDQSMYANPALSTIRLAVTLTLS